MKTALLYDNTVEYVDVLMDVVAINKKNIRNLALELTIEHVLEAKFIARLLLN